ncbi:MAG: 30S ribosomal protein S15 [Candidatus Parcubacteria bacterium]|nr:MAG: 30S ribosomal protein S15 [Candidatus Parcubacteria bacterium]
MTKVKEKVKEIVSKYGKNESDVGSPEVQVAILTEEILNLTKHLKENKKDKTSKRGLILKIVQRKKLLHYLKKKSYTRYKKIIQDLSL